MTLTKQAKYTIFFAFLSVYVFFAAYSLSTHSEWVYDNLLAITFLVIMLLLSNWLKLGMTGFLLFCVALTIHNFGTFGFYEWSWGIIGYDNIVHFVSSTVAAWIIFNFIARKLHIKKRQRVKTTVIDEHKVILFFLVFASVAMLGVGVELLEFGGSVFLGEGEGILVVGAGDSDATGAGSDYIDTMGDILVNVVGAIVGSLLYYQFKYKKKPWIKY